MVCPRQPEWPALGIAYWAIGSCLRAPRSNSPRRSFSQWSALGPVSMCLSRDNDVSMSLPAQRSVNTNGRIALCVPVMSEGPHRSHVSFSRQGDDLSTFVRYLYLILVPDPCSVNANGRNASCVPRVSSVCCGRSSVR